ncbi:DNA-3-methyladenine glycosylase family protein [Streptomyces sp. NPDC003710]
MSRAKATYLHDLARRQAQGIIDLEHMDDTDDATALAELTALPGVGPWTAHMFLIHQLHRPDILPCGDIGIRRAIQHAQQLTDLPAINDTHRRALHWAPYRTYAAALLWASLTPPPPTAAHTVPRQGDEPAVHQAAEHGDVREGAREQATGPVTTPASPAL